MINIPHNPLLPRVCILPFEYFNLKGIKLMLKCYPFVLIDGFYYADCVLLYPSSIYDRVLNIVKEIRSISAIPILVMNDNYNQDKVNELYAYGIDSYLPSTIHPDELYHRIAVWVKRYKGALHKDKVMIYKGIHLFHQKIILPNGNTFHLTPTEHVLATYFLSNPNMLITTEFIMSLIYGGFYNYSHMRSLDVARHKFNKKIRNIGLNISAVNRKGLILENYKN